MSKSLRRVTLALQTAGLDITPQEIGDATTAQMAADLVGCTIAQIAKSIMFRGETSGAVGVIITDGYPDVADTTRSTAARLVAEGVQFVVVVVACVI